jgi:hypothetical protein
MNPPWSVEEHIEMAKTLKKGWANIIATSRYWVETLIKIYHLQPEPLWPQNTSQSYQLLLHFGRWEIKTTIVNLARDIWKIFPARATH